MMARLAAFAWPVRAGARAPWPGSLALALLLCAALAAAEEPRWRDGGPGAPAAPRSGATAPDDPALGICRGRLAGRLRVGQLQDGRCRVSWGAHADLLEAFEWLDLGARDTAWTNGAHGDAPAGAIAAGVAPDGSPLYVCRARHDGLLRIGGLEVDACVIGPDGVDYGESHYQVLVRRAAAPALRLRLLNGNDGTPLPATPLYVFALCGKTYCTLPQDPGAARSDASGEIAIPVVDDLTRLELMHAPGLKYCDDSANRDTPVTEPRTVIDVAAALRTGVVSRNDCNRRLEVTAQPGQIVFFLRPLTVRENLLRGVQF